MDKLPQKRRSQSFVNKKYRNWGKVIESLQQYNRNSSHLGHMVDLIHYMQGLSEQGIKIKLNIPATLSGIHDNCLTTCFDSDQDQFGHVTFMPNITKSAFDSIVEKNNAHLITALSEKDQFKRKFFSEQTVESFTQQFFPFICIKEKIYGEKVDSNTIILSREEYRKLSNIESDEIAQAYIHGHSYTASITRFFYYPDKEHCSAAYKIDNYEHFMHKRISKKLWKIKKEEENSFAFFKVLYTNKAFYQQTKTLISLIESNLKMSVKKIVCEWVLDLNNRYFLTDVKEVKLQEKRIAHQMYHSLSDMFAVLQCSVCQQKYSLPELRRLVTQKMVWEFFEHLKKRNVELTFTPKYRYSFETARVCNLCYMLVTSEATLINLEYQIGELTHSAPKDEPLKALRNMNNSAPKSNEDQEHNPFLKDMYSWRLFLYIEDLRDFMPNPETTLSSYYIMIKIHDQVTAFKLLGINSQKISIKGIKIHYFYSESQKIEEFLSQSQITIRITSRCTWDSVVAQGSSSSLYEEGEKNTLRKHKQILLFDQRAQYCVLGLHLGVKMECLQKIDILNFNPVATGIYLSGQGNNSMCQPLPAEWMEAIDAAYNLEKITLNNFDYQLALRPKQIKTMLPTLPKNIKRLIL